MTGTLKPAFAYYRVSSKAQNLQDQQHAVARAAQAHGYELVMHFEEKQTAKYLKRPELDRLRAAARAGELPARLYVFRYDRLTRSGIRDTLNLIHELKEAGIEVWSVSDGFPLSGPVGDFVLAGLAFGAQLERLSGDERRAASRTRRKEQGLPFGRPPRLGAEQEADVLRLAAERRSVRQIAVALKVPRTTVNRIIKKAAAAAVEQACP